MIQNLFHKIISLFRKQPPPPEEPTAIVDLTPPPPLLPEKPKKTKLKRCPQNEKVMFTREQAEASKKKHEKAQPAANLRIYCCEFCSSWHLTHKKKKY